jgi:SsrA-binding protein
MKIISDNRKAYHNFFIEDKFEAGIELFGWEVKSARAGNVNLHESFVFFERKKDTTTAFLKNAHFPQYEFADIKTQEERRDRRLLLNKSEIEKLSYAVLAKGLSCVPTKIYFNERGRVKVEIAMAKGKHKFDKKNALRDRDISRAAEREAREH